MTDALILVAIYAPPFVLWIWAEVLTARVVEAVREMDAQDHAHERYADLIKERDDWIRRTNT